MSIENHYNQDVEIYVKSQTTGFQPVISWTLLSSVRGMIDQLQGDERLGEDGLSVVATHILYINVTDVKVVDRIIINDNVYDIYEIHNPNGRDHHLELKLKLLPGGIESNMQIGS